MLPISVTFGDIVKSITNPGDWDDMDQFIRSYFRLKRDCATDSQRPMTPLTNYQVAGQFTPVQKKQSQTTSDIAYAEMKAVGKVMASTELAESLYESKKWDTRSDTPEKRARSMDAALTRAKSQFVHYGNSRWGLSEWASQSMTLQQAENDKEEIEESP